MEVSTLQQWKESIPIYITIACVFTALIGGGWFAFSYLKGNTVLNNQDIIEYVASDHTVVSMNKASISPPLTLVASEETEEEDEELEEDELEEESEDELPDASYTEEWVGNGGTGTQSNTNTYSKPSQSSNNTTTSTNSTNATTGNSSTGGSSGSGGSSSSG
ncbi:hypothetical protein, partial [Gracilibacillus halotolerans]